jgi:uncharacterized protein YjbJ (UPF0337 family)
MSDATSDRVEGTVDELKGRGKKTWGELTNDEEKQVEGDMSKAVGKLRRADPDVEDEMDETVKDWTDQ